MSGIVARADTPNVHAGSSPGDSATVSPQRSTVIEAAALIDGAPALQHGRNRLRRANRERVGGRVLQLSKFYPPVMGGIETVAWEITEGLNRAGAKVDVLCSHHRPATVVERSDHGYRIVRAGSFGRVLSTSVAPAMVGAMRRLRDRYDVIHLHMPDPMAALAVFANRPKARLVVHWHSDVVRQRVAMHAYRHLQDWVLNRADAIIATSSAYAQSSAALRPFHDKVVVIPIGISDSRLSASPQTTESIRARYPGKRIVFSLGRMTHYKGFDVLVRAATALPNDTVVLIGGEGLLLDDLRRTVTEHNLDGKVHVLGHIRDDELPSYFDACDVFCMSSTLRAEAYGVAIVEAMVMGKPIVATDIPGSGVPWVNIHRETGLNVPVGNPVALAAALCSLLADAPMRRRLGQAARHRYEVEFRAELMTERMLRLYESIGLADSGRRQAEAPDSIPATLPMPWGTVPEAAAALSSLSPETLPMPTAIEANVAAAQPAATAHRAEVPLAEPS
jgi:glycosyltransferase involved in cell wall biosynthesis